MVKTTSTAVVLGTILTVAVATRIDAAPGPETIVVLHVTDRAPVATDDLVEAEKQVARVYEAISVRVVWTRAPRRSRRPTEPSTWT